MIKTNLRPSLTKLFRIKKAATFMCVCKTQEIADLYSRKVNTDTALSKFQFVRSVLCIREKNE